jgi:hypothetical protein
MRLTVATLAAMLALPLAVDAQAPPAAAPAPCTPVNGVQFVCGLQAPEDLVVVPGGRWVVAGAFGGNGGVYLIRASDRAATRVYPTATSVDRFDAKAYAGCPGPADAATKAKYQTHGLSIQPGANNVHRLLVVAASRSKCSRSTRVRRRRR